MWLIALLAGFVVGGIARADDPADERRRQIESMSPAERCRCIENMSLAERRWWIEGLDPAQKQRLLRQQERFAKLEPAEQQQLRQLWRDLQGDPNAEELRRVMHRYCQWLKELPPYERAEVLDLAPRERITRIAQLRNRQKDTEGLLRWMEQYVAKNEAQILKAIPEPRRHPKAKPSPAMRRRVAMWIMWQRLGRRPGRAGRLPEDELADLRSHLSEETRKDLEAKPADAQRQFIADLLRDEVSRHFSSRRLKGGPPSAELQKQLDEFFETLSKEQQDRLLSLPGDEMQEALRRMYQFGLPPEWPMRWGPGPRPGGRAGPPGPPRAGPPQSRNGPRPTHRPNHGLPPSAGERKQPEEGIEKAG